MIGPAPTWKDFARARGARLATNVVDGFIDGARWGAIVFVVVWIAAPRAEDAGKWIARAAVAYRGEALRLQGYDQFSALPWAKSTVNADSKTDRK